MKDDIRLVIYGTLLGVFLIVVLSAVGGGPAADYLPGQVMAVTAVITLDRWLKPAIHQLLGAVAIVLAYMLGGTILVGSDVMGHLSVGLDALRYDRILHVVASAWIFRIVFDLQRARSQFPRSMIMPITMAAGALVESAELLIATAAPWFYSFELRDSAADLAANTAGVLLGALIALALTRTARARSDLRADAERLIARGSVCEPRIRRVPPPALTDHQLGAITPTSTTW